MLKVLFTVDTEIWCGGWDNLDAAFPDAFRRYVYGPTTDGDYALPGLFRILQDHGLKGVFFVEPLFATRFGTAPLEEVVGLVQEAGQEVQLHLHPEWIDEAKEQIVADAGHKRPYMREFSEQDQGRLIQHGLGLLDAAGSAPVSAFRAGSYALNRDTLKALRENALYMDSSYNPSYYTGVSDVAQGQVLTQPQSVDGVTIFPVTTYRDRGGAHLRHLQLTACSFQEMRRVLERAEEAGFQCVVIVAHNFELLTPAKTRVDHLLVRRLRKLCQFLASNPQRFQVCGFNDVGDQGVTNQPEPVNGSLLFTGLRYAEQLLRKLIW